MRQAPPPVGTRGRAPARQFGAARAEQDGEAALDGVGGKSRETLAHKVAQIALEKIGRQRLDLGMERALAGQQPPDRGAAPQQRAVLAKLELASGACVSSRARAATSPRSTRLAAERSVRSAPAVASWSGTKRNPSSRPTKCPSTLTSPSRLTDASSSAVEARRRTRNAERRSTKRWVMRSWSASDSLSSIERARSCQCWLSLSHSGRLAM